MRNLYTVYFLLLMMMFHNVEGQDTRSLFNKYVAKSSKKITKYSERRNRTTQKYLTKFNKRQAKFINKLCKVNPQLADAYYRTLSLQQNRLDRIRHNKQAETASQPTRIYNSYNDTLFNSIHFLNSEKTNAEIYKYKEELSDEAYVSDYIHEQKDLMKDITSMYPSLKSSFIKVDKTSYYFREQLSEYDRWFREPSAIENHALSFLKNDKSFAQFMGLNSSLKDLTNIPSDWGKSIKGLQTNSFVKSQQASVQKQMSNTDLDEIKDRVVKGTESISEMKSKFPNLEKASDLPSFKPNPLKTKRFSDRIHYIFDFNLDYKSPFVPNGFKTWIGLEYEAVPKITIQVTSTYHTRVKSLQSEIKATSQNGLGINTSIDYKCNSKLYCVLEYELFYGQIHTIHSFERDQLFKRSEDSFLAGLKLKYENKSHLTPKISILYDFNAEYHHPGTSQLVYKLGWVF